MNCLITGAAGFIGAELAHQLARAGHSVVGVDNFNDYYDVSLKRDRVAAKLDVGDAHSWSMIELDVADREAMDKLFAAHDFEVVIHLAAQAGVRYSLVNPAAYIDANLVGFGNVLEGCRQAKVPRLIYASSSSVYGANDNFPFREEDRVDNPVSLYAATKKANELMAHSYAHLYEFECVGLRFFTVYGPWGRPDMAPFRFASRMMAGETLPVYNHGQMIRDFTFIDDICEGISRVVEAPQSTHHHRIYNIGRGQPVQLLDFINQLATALDCEPRLEMLPMQDGDVPRTMADSSRLQADYGYAPTTEMADGVAQFARWYQAYYGGS